MIDSPELTEPRQAVDRAQLRRRAYRAFCVVLFLGALVTIWAVMMAGVNIRNLTQGEIEQSLFGLPLFTAERTGDTNVLRPAFGVPIVLLVAPAAFAGVVWLLGRRNTR
jgi:hypothetical protein